MPPGRRHLEDRQQIIAPGGTHKGTGSSRRQKYLLARAALALAAFLVVGTAAPAHADFETGVAAFDGGDFTTAYDEWLPVAAGGDPFAQRNIGHLYRLGLGVPQDFAVALSWYQRAADQGLVRAQANLANMMLRGQGIDHDPEGAASWFHRAASAGHAISQFNIGQMYRKGLAVPQDRGLALGWFHLAADVGHERSIELVAIMSAEGIEPASDDALLEAPFGQDAGSPARLQKTKELTKEEEEEAARLTEDDDPFGRLLGDDEAVNPPKFVADKRVASAIPAATPPSDATAAPQTAAVELAPAFAQAVLSSANTESFRVQLAAYRTPNAAATRWQTLKTRHEDLLGALELTVAQVNLGERGVFHRLQAGP
ncbi:MAG: tetratricopeptide repeat protein, partial [Alphaproteobacteria bacterium]|nr:tetratricopeptide repeat protein [Alphaproteobacteria bacterium]